MERWGNNRKRAREGDEGRDDLARGEKKKNKKKQPSRPQITNLVDDDVEEFDTDKLEHSSSFDDDDDDDDLSNTCRTATAYERMFDFPWLKEGMNSFKSEDYCQQLQLEDSFSSFNSNLFEASTSNHSGGPEFPGPQPNLCNSLAHHKIVEEEEDEEEENDLLTFKADELEGTDWIWSSQMLDDQPSQLAARGFNKVA